MNLADIPEISKSNDVDLQTYTLQRKVTLTIP